MLSHAVQLVVVLLLKNKQNNLVLGQIVSSSSPDICVVSKDMIMMERRIRGGIYVH